MKWPETRIIAIAATLLVLSGLGVLGMLDGYLNLGAAFDPMQAEFTGSQACADCHADRHESWFQTYHRSMTQEASAASVQGIFDGRNLDYWGLRVRPVQQDGRYFFEYIDPESDRMINRLEIERTVGSNRYQQYLARLDESGTYVRLHYLWHNQDQRWIHMNAAFLGPDDTPFDSHVAIWNQNCIFCHNTGVEPNMTNYTELQQRAMAGEAVDPARDTRFESVVAELGISCETCHGPGSEHAQRASKFWTRQAMHLSGGLDTSIVNPVRLEGDLGSQVCGQCHAQRVPRKAEWIRDWMRSGPSYRPGQDLYQHVTPVARDTRIPVAGREDLFKARFWADGTPRLTAYEYQGMLQSTGHEQGVITCMDCHSMHDGNPSGQLTDRNRGNAPCLRCHQDYRREAALTEHSRHAADGPGSLCYNCHMPQIVYGVMDIHRSHRIESPDAAGDARNGRPNACLNCHLDQSTRWAMNELNRYDDEPASAGSPIDQARIGEDPIGKGPSGDEGIVKVERLDGGDWTRSEAMTLLIGDPVHKAVSAWRAGQQDSALRGRHRAWLVPYLLAAMADHYPASRRFSHQSLLRILEDWPAGGEIDALLNSLAGFDFMASADQREAPRLAALAAWTALDKQHWPAPPIDSGLTADYRLPAPLLEQFLELGRHQDKQISIGE
ncbi:MAG: cytochrome c3 family protein [Wenzhouxiangellaceae bacterium]|nr:cytochrome c3 family protein [Wenzhouxiangellaceae bacterium]